MSKLKRAFTIIMCILLTLPMRLVSKPNNVYAAVGMKPTNNTISTALYVRYSAGNADSGRIEDSENTVSYDLRNYDQASFTWTCAMSGSHAHCNWAVSQVILTMRDNNNNKDLLSFSKTYNNPNNMTQWPDTTYSKTVDWDLQFLRNNGEDLSNVSFHAYVKAGSTYYYNWSSASITNVSLFSYTPSFQPNSYVQSNGNLTRLKIRTF